MNKNNLENVYGYHLDHGNIIIFGDNLKYCIQYIDSCINSVEDICEYCKTHELLVSYISQRKNINTMITYFHVRKLAKRYNVFASSKELIKYTIHQLSGK